MRNDNYLIIGLLLGGVIMWLWLSSRRNAGGALADAGGGGGGGDSSAAGVPRSCPAVTSGWWRPHATMQWPKQPPTGT